MSATRYVEGPDRDALLARIEGQGGEVVSERRVRRGGVLGFFAHELVGVTYKPTAPDTPPAAESAPQPAESAMQPAKSALDDLLDEADAADGPSNSAAEQDFAALLAAYAAEPPAAPAIPEPVVSEQPAPKRLSTRTRLEMLSDLRGIGVPFQHAPHDGETSLYAAIEQVIDELPPAPLPPTRAGEILVLAGPIEIARRIANEIAPQMHVPASAIWIANGSDASARRISGPRNASRRVVELRTADVPSIVVVVTDIADMRGDPRPSWPAQVIAALDPTAVWAVVDARHKTEDLRAELNRLGPVHALAVDGATRTHSPATVWDLDLPVALLDGRTATPGTWASLLFDALRASA